MFQARTYRQSMETGRFKSFTVQYKDSDLWIGVDPNSYSNKMAEFAIQKLTQLRSDLEGFIQKHPYFGKSFEPIIMKTDTSGMIQQMAIASQIANTGPMAAVAGTFSEYLGKSISAEFNTNEIVVENGGDIYLEMQENMIMSVYAGDSPLSGKVGIEIPKEKSPLGVCTSAGTVGPSKSFGKADAVMVVHRDTAIADALATSIGNKVKTANDIQTGLSICNEIPEVISVLIICEGQLGIKGELELRILR